MKFFSKGELNLLWPFYLEYLIASSIFFASAFVVSDVLGKKWEPNFHKPEVRETLNKLVDAGVECLR